MLFYSVSEMHTLYYEYVCSEFLFDSSCQYIVKQAMLICILCDFELRSYLLRTSLQCPPNFAGLWTDIQTVCSSKIWAHPICVPVQDMFSSKLCSSRMCAHPNCVLVQDACSSKLCARPGCVLIQTECTTQMCAHPSCVHFKDV
jgi:hypothetical protein